MSYYSIRFMGTFGKLFAFFYALSLVRAIMAPAWLNTSDLVMGNIFSFLLMLPIIYSRHEDEIEKTQSDEEMGQYVFKIILPSILSVLLSTAAMSYVFDWTPVTKYFGQEFVDWAIFMSLLFNLFFLLLYYANVYMKFFGMKSFMLRMSIIFLILLVGGGLLGMYTYETLPDFGAMLRQFQMQIPKGMQGPINL